MADKMSPRAYAKYDRIFMVFGSVMNGMQGKLGDDWETVADSVWHWCREKVDELVDGLYGAGDDTIKPL